MFPLQSESTLWRLKFLVKDALENQEKTAVNTGCNDNKDSNNKESNKNNNNSRNGNKRKREICDAIAKTAKRNNRKCSSWSFTTGR